jgi:alpha-beta hydrolase superfamily lysophospholipase
MRHALAAAALMLFLPACSSLLYYPQRPLLIPPERFQLKPEEVNFQSQDGTKLFGWLFTQPQMPKAVILFYHGNGENLSSHYVSLKWILPHGYDFFIFDYRGYGRSEGAPEPKGTTQDGEAAQRWLRARYPNTPIVVYAQSLGGAIALRNTIDLRNEIHPTAIAVDSTFASYEEVGRRTLAKGWLSWPFQWLAWLALSDRYAPDGDIAKLAPLPVLVLHSEGDRTVPYVCGQEIFAQAKEPKQFWTVPGAGHTDAFTRHGAEFEPKFLAWLQSVL